MEDIRNTVERLTMIKVAPLTKAALCVAFAVACALTLFGCNGESSADKLEKNDGVGVTIGTLATEDFLPMWKAQDMGLFEKDNLKVNIEVFNSAQELSAALAAKAIDGAMTDIPVAANLSQGGTPMTISWVTLGQKPDEGRFGIMVGPKSQVNNLGDLAKTPIGVGSGTMLEYVMDKLMLDAGIAKEDIKKEELKKLPVRFQMVMQGEVEAGVFPASLLALGQSQGAKVIADDTSGDNLSQSIMAFRTEFANTDSGKAIIEKLSAAWDTSVDGINSEPEAQRALMLANAKLPDNLKDTYPVPTYPKAQKPDAKLVESVLDWMKEKSYITSVKYDSDSGNLTA